MLIPVILAEAPMGIMLSTDFGNTAAVLEHYGLTAENIAAKAKEAVALKK